MEEWGDNDNIEADENGCDYLGIGWLCNISHGIYRLSDKYIWYPI